MENNTEQNIIETLKKQASHINPDKKRFLAFLETLHNTSALPLVTEKDGMRYTTYKENKSTITSPKQQFYRAFLSNLKLFIPLAAAVFLIFILTGSDRKKNEDGLAVANGNIEDSAFTIAKGPEIESVFFNTDEEDISLATSYGESLDKIQTAYYENQL